MELHPQVRVPLKSKIENSFGFVSHLRKPPSAKKLADLATFLKISNFYLFVGTQSGLCTQLVKTWKFLWNRVPHSQKLPGTKNQRIFSKRLVENNFSNLFAIKNSGNFYKNSIFNPLNEFSWKILIPSCSAHFFIQYIQKSAETMNMKLFYWQNSVKNHDFHKNMGLFVKN